MAYGNLALDLILGKNPRPSRGAEKTEDMTTWPIEVVVSSKKIVNVQEHYDVERPAPSIQEF